MKIIIIVTIVCTFFAIIEIKWKTIALYLLNKKLNRYLKNNIKKNEKLLKNDIK